MGTSLYEYFDSKHAIYAAMFADANRQLLRRLDSVTLPADPRRALEDMQQTLERLRSVAEDDHPTAL